MEFDELRLKRIINNVDSDFLLYKMKIRWLIERLIEPECKKLTKEEIDKFNYGCELLLKCGYRQERINSVISSLKGGIENEGYIRDKNGKYSYINKINTNYSAVREMLVFIIKCAYEDDAKSNEFDIKKIYKQIISGKPREGLMLLLNKQTPNSKTYLERMIVHYILRGGDINNPIDINRLEMFSDTIRETTKNGDKAEESIKNKFRKKGFDILYEGENGDRIDMLFGVDIIVYREDVGYKTVQVKKKINWTELKKRKYDGISWVSEGIQLPTLYDKIRRNTIDLNKIYEKI